MSGVGAKFWLLLAVAALLVVPAKAAIAATLEVTIGVGDNILEISGWTSSNAEVTVTENNSVIGNTVAAGDGTYQITLSGQTPGLRSIKLYARDSVNRLSDIYAETINVAMHATTSLEVFLPPTIELGSSSLVQGEGLVIKGESLPSSAVVVRVDNNDEFTTTTNSSGKWQIIIPTAGFYIGTHTLFAYTNAGGGLFSEPTASRTFQVRGGTGEEQPAPPIARLAKPIITFPSSGFRSIDQAIIVRGLADANIQIELWADGELIGSVFSNSRGEWELGYSLAKRQAILTARACVESRCSTFSDPVTVYFTGFLGEGGLVLSLEKHRYYKVGLGSQIELTLTYSGGTVPYEFLIDWGDGQIEQFNQAEDGSIDVHHEYEVTGLFNGRVTLLDKNDHQADRFFSVEVVERQFNYSFVWLTAGITGIGALLWLLGRWRLKQTDVTSQTVPSD